MVHFSDTQLRIVRTIATQISYARRGDFLRGSLPARAENRHSDRASASRSGRAGRAPWPFLGVVRRRAGLPAGGELLLRDSRASMPRRERRGADASMQKNFPGGQLWQNWRRWRLSVSYPRFSGTSRFAFFIHQVILEIRQRDQALDGHPAVRQHFSRLLSLLTFWALECET